MAKENFERKILATGLVTLESLAPKSLLSAYYLGNKDSLEVDLAEFEERNAVGWMNETAQLLMMSRCGGYIWRDPRRSSCH